MFVSLAFPHVFHLRIDSIIFSGTKRSSWPATTDVPISTMLLYFKMVPQLLWHRFRLNSRRQDKTNLIADHSVQDILIRQSMERHKYVHFEHFLCCCETPVWLIWARMIFNANMMVGKIPPYWTIITNRASSPLNAASVTIDYFWAQVCLCVCVRVCQERSIFAIFSQPKFHVTSFLTEHPRMVWLDELVLTEIEMP